MSKESQSRGDFNFKSRGGNRIMTGGGTKSQYITAAVVIAMTLTFLSFYNLYCNFAVFMEMEM